MSDPTPQEQPEQPTSIPPGEALQNPQEKTQKRPRRRRRWFWITAAFTALLAASVATLCWWATSKACEDLVRRRIVAELENSTGGRVEIAAFHWSPFSLEAEADGLVLHGLEAPSEDPLAQVERLHLRLSLLGFWSPRILLRDLEVGRPRLHLIVYADGSTNQPQPRKPKKPGKPALETIFNLKASHFAITEAMLHYESRAAAFDFQNRYAPLSVEANDLSLLASYNAPSVNFPESYHIETGARDLSLTRGPAPKPGLKTKTPPVEGLMQATLDLTRNAVLLRSLRLTSRGHGIKDRTLEINGSLQDFVHPRWQAVTHGELDMRLLDPLTGYPFAPQGIAHLNLNSAGESGLFRIDGGVHVDGGAYIGTGVVATGIQFDARVHADAEQLLITQITARLRQGGEIDGTVALDHWLPVVPGQATMQPAGNGKAHGGHAPAAPPKPVAPADVITIPVNGKVTADFKNVALDTILEMVCLPPFQHLGFDTRVNGHADAQWVKGDVNTLVVPGLLALTPPAQVAAGMVPATGVVDGTYTQRDGAVDLRKLELNLPSSQIQAHGHLGAYPLVSPTAIYIDLQTGNLSEFDTVLRDLDLPAAGNSGVAALPIALKGQGEFHGTWSNSLYDPRITGVAKATQLTMELPTPSASVLPKASSAPPQVAPPQVAQVQQVVHWDQVDAAGSYSANRIDIGHAELRQGKTTLDLDGSLTASMVAPKPGRAALPVYDSNSLLHAHLHASQIGMEQLLPLTSLQLPVTGALSAQLALDGPLHTLDGSGWMQLDGGSIYGEPVSRLRAEGTMERQTLKLHTLSINSDAGKIGVSGSFALASHQFQVEADASGLDISRLAGLRKQGLAAAGKLDFSISGSGSLNDPHLEAHAALANLALGGEPLGSIQITAHTANRAVSYDLTSRLDAAELTAHGQTSLDGDHPTQARLEFSRFNIGALLKLAQVQGLSGESALAGAITLDGPLSHPESMRGEARIQELAVGIAGVHLHSEGGLHATLANARLNLDPLHVTGEDTDMHLQGSLSLKDKHQLDLAASGSINLKLIQSLDSDLTASGTSTFEVQAHGPLLDPGLRGRVDFQNGSVAWEDIPNGLSQLHGTLEFNQNRLEVRSLTAMTGGGQLSLGGYLSYQNGIYANLTATGTGVRIRYPQGVSSLADASLSLQGPRNNLLLSGTVQITRFAISPDFDFAGLAVQAGGVQAVAPLDAPSNHIRLNVHFTSSPQLNFQNAYAKLAGNVDLRLRGTVASPSLLGRVSITEGSAILAGTRYELQRGELSFTNPVRIQPSIDLNATARVEDYDISLGLHGTLDKPVVTYRSDPPLPEADVVALLALGRTENQQRIYTQQQMQAGANPATDALLGGALNATVSSRVQKLFGAGSVKLDPNYLGALGNSTSRIIVEEQLGRNLTLTYATNVNTTNQQLIQAEVAINHHVSLLVARDESGVFSMVLKTTRRYR